MNKELKTSEMDQIIAKQMEEQTKRESAKEQQNNAKNNRMEEMQMQDALLRFRLMGEELIKKQIENIVLITNTIKIVDSESLKATLSGLLEGYAVQQKQI